MAKRASFLGRARPGLDDMTLLQKADNAGIKDNLKQRLEAKCIYTYIGNVLIAMNPFTWIDMYNADAASRYMHASRLDMPPHIFMIAESAFRAMSDEEESQCVIISGESGAGKTEASKQIQTYLALCSAGKGSREVDRVKKVFLESNPLLEAFGNAKTLRNNNSSRFGKYFELLFDRLGTPKGGVVTNYLLEKSRTVKPGKGERNFHVFYQVVCGATAAERGSLGLGPRPEDYQSLATCTTVDGVNDHKEHATTRQAMEDVGLAKQDQDAAYRIVAACLALGSLKFGALAVGDAEGSVVVSNGGGGLDLVGRLLSFDGAALATLEQALTSKRLETMAPGGMMETYDVPLNPTQAALVRDALLKSLYSKLFDMLVLKINEALEPHDEARSVSAGEEELLQMSVLDIYGFEIFEKNGFEQLAINFVNEKLQQIFIALTLKAEQEEYVAEGIAWEEVKYFNNKIVCDLVEGKQPPGLLLVLDDVCRQMHSRPGAQVDAGFREKVASVFGSKHRHFLKTKAGFCVKHYAGDVDYAVEGFAQSNRDELRLELLEVLLKSTDPLILTSYEEDRATREKEAEEAAAGGRGKKSSGLTAGRKIRDQCGALVGALMMCEPHYVRCVKSNDEKRACTVDGPRVEHQSKYLGLPENVRVRRAGFAYRTEYHRFLERYKTLSSATYPREWTGNDADGARKIVQAASREGDPALASLQDPQQTQFGKTKLFVKQPEVFFALEKLRERKLGEFASKIAKAWRDAFGSREFVEMQRNVGAMMRGKRRRAASMSRPYDGDYLTDAAARDALARVMRFHGDQGRLVFVDDLVRQLVRDATWAPRLLAVSSSGHCYVMENKLKASKTGGGGQQQLGGGGGGVRQWFLRRRVKVNEITALAVSRKADDVLVFHTSSRPVAPANKAELLKSGQWEKNAEVAACPKTGRRFSMFGDKRHHCRASGKIYAAEAVQTLATLPDLGWFTPQRIADDMVGLHSADAMEDFVFSLERRSEVLAVLAKQGRLSLDVADAITLNPTPMVNLTLLPARTLTFVDGADLLSEAAPPPLTMMGTKGGAQLEIAAAAGVSERQMEDRRQRTEDRRAARDARRKAEAELRRARNADRDAQRRADFRARLEEKKRKKAADRAERARAAGGTSSKAAKPQRKFKSTVGATARPVATAAATTTTGGAIRRATTAAVASNNNSNNNHRPATAAAPQKPQRIVPPPEVTSQTTKKPPPPPKKRQASPPPPPPPPAHIADAEYYYQSAVNGERCGPATFGELKAEFEAGKTNAQCLIYAFGVADEWKAMDQCPELVGFLERKQPPPFKPPPLPDPDPKPEQPTPEPEKYRQEEPEPAYQAPEPPTPAPEPAPAPPPPRAAPAPPCASKYGRPTEQRTSSASDELAAKLARRREKNGGV